MSFSSLLSNALLLSSICHALPASERTLRSRTTNEVVNPALFVSVDNGQAVGDQIKETSTTSTVVPYHLYTGSGTSWPSMSQWATFDQMFANNQPILSSSCSQWKQPNNSEEEINDLAAAINATAAVSDVDKRFILAIIMQESAGCVRTPTSVGWVNNPGLMQDHNGVASCNTNTVTNGVLGTGGVASVPCTSAQIAGMVSEGTAGTTEGDGLANCINEAAAEGLTGAIAYYGAGRIYNTGSYTAGTDLGAPLYGTSCYASDIANRLMGWAGPETLCTLPNP